MGVTSFLFFQSKTAFNINTCQVISNISQLLDIEMGGGGGEVTPINWDVPFFEGTFSAGK